METIQSLLANATLRRVAVGGITAAIVGLNKKLGLGLETSDTAELVGLAIAYILASNAKEAHIAGKEAAAKVTTLQDAVNSANSTGSTL